MNRSRLWIVPLALVALGALPAIESAAQEEPAGFQSISGRITFRAYCSNCHGSDATGNGNIAKFLKVKPANLTLLSHENDGEFPEERVYKAIDGRKDVKTHGPRDMPIWGEVFQSALAAAPAKVGEPGEERAHRKITELVRFLETIQVEPEE